MRSRSHKIESKCDIEIHTLVCDAVPDVYNTVLWIESDTGDVVVQDIVVIEAIEQSMER